MRIEEDEEIGGAVAPVFAVEAFQLPGLGRDGLTHLADKLSGAFIKADHGALGVGLLGVKVEHVFHAGDVFGIDLGDAPHVLAPGLELVFRKPAAHCLARQAFVLGQLDEFAGQQLQGPTGPAGRWLGAGRGDQKRLFLAGKLALRARMRLFAERSLKACLHKAAFGAIDRRAAGADRSFDRLIAGAGIGRQKNLRPLQLPRRAFAPAQ